MGKTIILTTANIEENSNNTKLVYNFPSGGYTFKNDMIAVLSIYQYFSIFNITSDYGNNTFSYVWFDGIEYTITIPDGYYEISDLNSYFQSIMIANTHYMTNSAGQFIAGNNAPTLIKELRSVILHFMEKGQIQKQDGYDLLKELSAVEN